jgi:hypothetical protein
MWASSEFAGVIIDFRESRDIVQWFNARASESPGCHYPQMVMNRN